MTGVLGNNFFALIKAILGWGATWVNEAIVNNLEECSRGNLLIKATDYLGVLVHKLN
jgi:hypothetical protein